MLSAAVVWRPWRAAGWEAQCASSMVAAISITGGDASGLQNAQEVLAEGPGVAPDTLFVVPGDEVPVDFDAGFLKCGSPTTACICSVFM